MPSKILSRFLDTNGDGSGTNNAIGDYSGGVEKFFYRPETRETVVVTRLIASVGDAGGGSAEEYGNIGSALTNGITIAVETTTGGVLNQLTDTAVPIKTNAGWGEYCYDVDIKTWGSGEDLLLARWTFSKSGTDIVLNRDKVLAVSLNDSCTGLVSHRFLVQGYYKHGGDY